MAVFSKSPDPRGERVIADLINRVNDNIQRLRVIEQRMQALDSRINSAEQNFISVSRNVQKSLSERDSRIAAIEEKVGKIETAHREILKQLKTAATKSNMDELRELFSIYDPLRSSFVTKEEMERFVNERLSR